jgi:hypothetical protein
MVVACMVCVCVRVRACVRARARHACYFFCPFHIQCVPVSSVHVCVCACTKCLSDNFKETSDKLKVEFKMRFECY